MPTWRVSCNVPVSVTVEADTAEEALKAFMDSTESQVSAADGCEDITVEKVNE